MNLFNNIALAVVLATFAGSALGDTIYKCLQADGRIAFSSLPCAGSAKETRQLAVPPPEADDVSAARRQQERARLAAAERQFSQRQRVREAGYGRGTGATAIANSYNVRQSTDAARSAQKELEQREAAGLNKARKGN